MTDEQNAGISMKTLFMSFPVNHPISPVNTQLILRVASVSLTGSSNKREIHAHTPPSVAVALSILPTSHRVGMTDSFSPFVSCRIYEKIGNRRKASEQRAIHQTVPTHHIRLTLMTSIGWMKVTVMTAAPPAIPT
jgi:hypothetical protein